MVGHDLRANALPAALTAFFANNPKIAVAYSGGLDSRFLCHAARLSACDILAYHAAGPHVPAHDTESALSWAEKHAIPVIRLDFNPLELDDVAKNNRQRCYACKRQMFRKLLLDIGKHGQDRTLCDGGNSDDLKKFRPGMAAAARLGICSPLALASLGKKDIHRLAALTEMENPQQKARPCLITRFAYGLEPDERAMLKLSQAEKALEALFSAMPDADFRLRISPKPKLQINFDCSMFGREIQRILIQHGFGDFEIVQDSSISGFYDRNAPAESGSSAKPYFISPLQYKI